MNFESILQQDLTGLVSKFGDLGVFLAMFLESSFVPIPSEVIIVAAGAIGIPLASALIFGALGSTLGAMVGYALGRYAAMPVLLKFGRFILIKPHHIQKAEEFTKKYGTISVLIGRIVPVVPFKVFSIAAGITGIPFLPFVFCTLVGVLPRIFLLTLFGATIVKYTKAVIILSIFAVLVFLAFKALSSFYDKKNTRIEGGSK